MQRPPYQIASMQCLANKEEHDIKKRPYRGGLYPYNREGVIKSFSIRALRSYRRSRSSLRSKIPLPSFITKSSEQY